MNQNDANMEGATGLRISSYPNAGKVWVTPTIWSSKSRKYVVRGGTDRTPANRAFPANIADLPDLVDQYVGRPVE